jgi:hypothetical protein
MDQRCSSTRSRTDARLRTSRLTRRVSLNLNAEPDGSGVVTLAGEARLRYDAETAPGYQDKYSDQLAGFGLSAEEFERQYSIEIRFIPMHVRAW